MKIPLKKDLVPFIADAKKQIEALCDGERTTPGKAFEYAKKIRRAQNVIDGLDPDPILVREAEISGFSVRELAERVKERSASYFSKMDKLELKRREAVLKLKAAKSPKEISEIVSNFETNIGQ